MNICLVALSVVVLALRKLSLQHHFLLKVKAGPKTDIQILPRRNNMSLISAKYLPEHGWILCKNRDRSYKPVVRLRKTYRNNVERLYIWDALTHYSEGINEYGIALLGVDIQVDDNDYTKAKDAEKQSTKRNKRTFYSPNGLRIRKALYERTVYNVTKKLIELEAIGSFLVADRSTCFLLEGAYIKEDGTESYAYEVREVPQSHVVVRTNHGILLPWTGYSLDVPEQRDARLASEARHSRALELIKVASSPEEVLEAISDMSNENPQFNPLRLDDKKSSIRTTGQIIIKPKELTLYYRPVWCQVIFDLEKLNNTEEKIFFEILSPRKIRRLRDVLEQKDFVDILGED